MTDSFAANSVVTTPSASPLQAKVNALAKETSKDIERSTTSEEPYRHDSALNPIPKGLVCADLRLRNAIRSEIRAVTRSLGPTELALCKGKLDVALGNIRTLEQINLPDALSLAACFGDLEVVNALIERSVVRKESLSAADSPIRKYVLTGSPLSIAYAYRWPAVISVLAEHRSPDNGWQPECLFHELPIRLRPCPGPEEFFEMLFMIPKTPPTDLSQAMIQFLSARFFFANPSESKQAVFEYLLDRQPNLLQQIRLRGGPLGRIPLHDAILSSHSYAIPQLLEEQASEQIRHRDNAGWDALLHKLWRAVEACPPHPVPVRIPQVGPAFVADIERFLEAGAAIGTQVKLKKDKIPKHLRSVLGVRPRFWRSTVVVTAKQMVKAIGDDRISILVGKHS